MNSAIDALHATMRECPACQKHGKERKGTL
jgi:hypothetical protein